MIDSKVTEIISPFESVIGNDFHAYKNHVIRVIKFTLELKENLPDDDKLKIIIAAVFHDIGLWTANTFDYLPPSIHQAEKYLHDQHLSDWRDEVTTIITYHHKLKKYKGQFSELVEPFRKADLIDLTKGLVSFGLPKPILKTCYSQYPILGFRRKIVGKFGKNLLKNPLRPLPMVKR